MPKLSDATFPNRPLAKLPVRTEATKGSPEGVGDTVGCSDSGVSYASLDGLTWTAVGVLPAAPLKAYFRGTSAVSVNYNTLTTFNTFEDPAGGSPYVWPNNDDFFADFDELIVPTGGGGVYSVTCRSFLSGMTNNSDVMPYYILLSINESADVFADLGRNEADHYITQETSFNLDFAGNVILEDADSLKLKMFWDWPSGTPGDTTALWTLSSLRLVRIGD